MQANHIINAIHQNIRLLRDEEHAEESLNELSELELTFSIIGIDFLQGNPGGLYQHSTQARALEQVLNGLSVLEQPKMKPQNLEIAQALFISALETLQEIGADIHGDPQFQQFIQYACAEIARFLASNDPKSSQADFATSLRLGQSILSSFLKNGIILSIPQGIPPRERPKIYPLLVQKSGLHLLQLLLKNEPAQQSMTLEAQDRIIQAALSVLLEYPGLLQHQPGLPGLIDKVLDTSAKANRIELFPVLLSMVLEQCTQNLYHVWDLESQEENLLLSALEQILQVVPQEVQNGGKRPLLSRTQFLDLLSDLLDQTVQNPALVSDHVNDKSMLAEVLKVTFQSLDGVPREHRLRWEMVEMLIHLNFRAALTSKAVLEKINWGKNGSTKPILSNILDLVVEATFSQSRVVGGEKLKLLQDIFEFVMEGIVADYPNRLGLVLVQMLLSPQSGLNFTEGFNHALAERMLQACLVLCSQHPQLVENDEERQRLLEGVVDAVTQAGIKQPGLLSDMMELVLLKTADNLDLQVENTGGQSEYLLVSALRETLAVLGAEAPTGRWKPRFTPEHLVQLTEFSLDEVVQNPAWITDTLSGKTLLREALDVTFRVLQKVPAGQRLNSTAVEYLLDIVFRSVSRSKKLLEPQGEEKEGLSILEQVLNYVLTAVFPPSEGAAVDKPQLLIDLLEYVFDNILNENPDKSGLALVELLFSDAVGIDFSKGFEKNTIEELMEAAMLSFSEQPELVRGKRTLIEIMEEMSPAIHVLNADFPQIGPKIVQLFLTRNAIMPGIFKTQSKDLFVGIEALTQFTEALAIERQHGRWLKELTLEQVLELIEYLISCCDDNPDFAQNNYVFKVLDAILSSVDNKADKLQNAAVLIQILSEHLLLTIIEHDELLHELQLNSDTKVEMGVNYLIEQFFELLGRLDKSTQKLIMQMPSVEIVLNHYLDEVEEYDLITSTAINRAIGKIQKIMDRFALGDLNFEEMMGEFGFEEPE